MEEKSIIKISSRLYKDIDAYCRLNAISTEEYIGKLLKKAFMEDKYGTAPDIANKKEKQVEVIQQEKAKEEVKEVKEIKPNTVKKEVKKVEEEAEQLFSAPKKRVLN